MLGVLLAKERFVDWYMPVNAKAIINDRDASICLRSIEIIAFVLEYCCFREDLTHEHIILGRNG